MRPSSSSLAAVVLLAAASSAEAVSLRGPEVLKLDWNTRALQAVDLDGNGRLDLLMINNDRATLEIFHQLAPGEERPKGPRSLGAGRWEPVLEDAPFRRESVTTGTTMFDVVTGDFDGDGRLELAYTGEPRALVLRLRQPDGSWLERAIPEAPAPLNFVSGLRAARLGAKDAKGTDLVLLGQKELAVFRHEGSGLGPPERHPLAEENCFGLEIVDVDADGRPDILYLTSGARDTARVRRQTASGRFGPEEIMSIKSMRSTLQHWVPAGEDRPVFAGVQNPTGQLEVFRFAEPATTVVPDNPLPSPRVFSPRLTTRVAAATALADFDGDGRTDVLTADPEGAQVILHRREADGTFTAGQAYPSFSDVRSVAAADWDGDGRSEVFLASVKEQVAGWTALTPAGRLGYPQPLPGTGKPIGVAAGDLDGDGRAEAVVLSYERNKATVEAWAHRAGAAPAAVSTQGFTTAGEPRALRLVDANQDGRLDLLVFGGSQEPLRIFVREAEGGWREASASPAFRRGLVEGAEAGGLSVLDVDGDGKAEFVLATGTAFARALRVGADDALEVVEQFNAREATAQVQAVFPLGRDLVLYDRRGESLQLLRRKADGVPEFAQSRKVGRIDLTAVEAAAGEVFFFGRDRFWWMPLASTAYEPRTVGTHATDLPDVSYHDVIAGDLDADGVPELVCIDPQSNLIEVLGQEAAGGWVSRLHFKVFEVDQHFQGRRGGGPEPRETIVADVTGDGRKDLVLLVHDRVLIYPQAE